MPITRRIPGFLAADQCDLEQFRALAQTVTELTDYPLAASIELGAVVYDADALRADGVDRRQAMAELAHALLEGPGIIVLRGAVGDRPIDRVTEAFWTMIAEERAHDTAAADHFAKPGANDRVWNVIEKLAIIDAEAFVDYFANDMIALAAEAWLGPDYQISAQVNVVNPGGEAQRPHRDYHLGFMTDAAAERFPAHAHRLSPVLTLQGAIAHCDMPVETGPTLYLPHSQKYEAGYLAWRRPDFAAYFDEHRVQVPLAKGDAVFFNPALFHAAGSNVTTDVRRVANLLQISSAMARTMETIDTEQMTLAVYPALCAARASGLDDAAVANVVTACAEGYAFPTNLDRDPPAGGLTPPSQADVVRRALVEEWSVDTLAAALAAHRARRSSRYPWAATS